jgi:hypothetical protein
MGSRKAVIAQDDNIGAFFRKLLGPQLFVVNKGRSADLQTTSAPARDLDLFVEMET